jgi:hypothetical protein
MLDINLGLNGILDLIFGDRLNIYAILGLQIIIGLKAFLMTDIGAITLFILIPEIFFA